MHCKCNNVARLATGPAIPNLFSNVCGEPICAAANRTRSDKLTTSALEMNPATGKLVLDADGLGALNLLGGHRSPKTHAKGCGSEAGPVASKDASEPLYSTGTVAAAEFVYLIGLATVAHVYTDQSRYSDKL
jgi:hypothetical protein